MCVKNFVLLYAEKKTNKSRICAKSTFIKQNSCTKHGFEIKFNSRKKFDEQNEIQTTGTKSLKFKIQQKLKKFKISFKSFQGKLKFKFDLSPSQV